MLRRRIADLDAAFVAEQAEMSLRCRRPDLRLGVPLTQRLMQCRPLNEIDMRRVRPRLAGAEAEVKEGEMCGERHGGGKRGLHHARVGLAAPGKDQNRFHRPPSRFLGWPQAARGLPESPAALPADHPALTSIFFWRFCASAVFGSVSVSTPLEKSAPIFSRSTPSGSEKLRWKAP
jgi:hypothetical protein